MPKSALGLRVRVQQTLQQAKLTDVGQRRPDRWTSAQTVDSGRTPQSHGSRRSHIATVSNVESGVVSSASESRSECTRVMRRRDGTAVLKMAGRRMLKTPVPPPPRPPSPPRHPATAAPGITPPSPHLAAIVSPHPPRTGSPVLIWRPPTALDRYRNRLMI